jgi:hypothetical protein
LDERREGLSDGAGHSSFRAVLSDGAGHSSFREVANTGSQISTLVGIMVVLDRRVLLPDLMVVLLPDLMGMVVDLRKKTPVV